MSFDVIYPNRKDKRKQYYKKSKRVSSSCRNHGSCPVCKDNRTFQDRKARTSAEDQIEEYLSLYSSIG